MKTKRRLKSGMVRQYLKCLHCPNVFKHDYTPYGLSNAIVTKPCHMTTSGTQWDRLQVKEISYKEYIERVKKLRVKCSSPKNSKKN